MSDRNMKKILVSMPIHPAGLEILKAREDIELSYIEAVSGPLPLDKVAGIDGMTLRTGNVTPEVLDAAPNLKVVARFGVGYDNVDVPACTERGVALAVVGAANALSVAELTLTFMLDLSRRVQDLDRETKAGNFAFRNQVKSFDMAGKKVLIIGFGRIGSRVSARCRAFEMDVLAYDPYIDSGLIEAAGARPVADFRAVLPEVDYVTVHCPKTPETVGIIGAAELAAMKDTAIVINCARGGLVDEPALTAALKEQRIFGAGLDVFAVEPPPADHPVFTAPNILLASHAAAMTEECLRRMSETTARNVLAGIDDTLDPAYVINTEVLR